MPDQGTIDRRNINHIPYRNWCPHYVKGKRKSNEHFKTRGNESQLSILHGDDFFFMKSEEGKSVGAPGLAMLDSKTRMLKARIVDKKGVDEHAIKTIKSFVDAGVQKIDRVVRQ